MKIIHRYIVGTFLTTFVTTLLVFTFVMTIGAAFRITDLLAKGISWKLIAQVFMYGVPPALSFAIPMSALAACLLLFGRLSADGEITAMRACGVSMWWITTPLLCVCLGATGVCLYVNAELSPRSFSAYRGITSNVGVDTPLKLLPSGRFIDDLPGIRIYIGRREEDILYDLTIYKMENGEVEREVRAKRARVRMSEDNKDMLLDLFDVRVDPWVDDKPGFFGEIPDFAIADVFKKRERRIRPEGMTMADLRDRIRNTAQYYPGESIERLSRQSMKLRCQLHERLALSMACFAFALLGIPLGIKTHRKESSIGVAISLGLAMMFYLFIITSRSLSGHPGLQPHLLMWLPVAISLYLGWFLMRRVE